MRLHSMAVTSSHGEHNANAWIATGLAVFSPLPESSEQGSNLSSNLQQKGN